MLENLLCWFGNNQTPILGLLGIVVSAWSAIAASKAARSAASAYKISKEEYRRSMTPRLDVQILDAIIPKYEIVRQQEFKLDSEFQLQTLVKNGGTSTITVTILITLTIPNGSKLVAKGWYGGIPKQLGPGEGFSGVIRWSENFPDHPFENVRYLGSPIGKPFGIDVEVKAEAWDSSDPTLRSDIPVRHYWVDFGSNLLIFDP